MLLAARRDERVDLTRSAAGRRPRLRMIGLCLSLCCVSFGVAETEIAEPPAAAAASAAAAAASPDIERASMDATSMPIGAEAATTTAWEPSIAAANRSDGSAFGGGRRRRDRPRGGAGGAAGSFSSAPPNNATEGADEDDGDDGAVGWGWPLRRQLTKAHAGGKKKGPGQTPTFLVLGVQKCGTSTLAAHMSSHPQVMPPTKKELMFFNGHDHVPSAAKTWHCDPPADKIQE